jgi:type IV pilus assembly protein PilQ
VLITKAQPQNAPVLAAQVQPQTPPALTEQVQPEKPPALPAPVQPEKPPAPTPAANLALEQQKASATPAPPPAAKKYTGEPISVDLKDVDLKDFFRLIHEISGLNIVLDPSVRGTLTLVLDDVPWDQALDVVLHNNGLGRELEGNILRIAAQDTFRKEAEAQRARIDAQALAVNKITVTRFLSYGRAKDVMPTIKKLLTTRGEVLADDRTNALIISDIPSIIPGIDRLITQLDRKTMQVEIEARVVSATRNFAQQFGTQLGFAWGNGKTSIGGNPSTGLSSQTYTSSSGSFPYFTSAGSIPLFSNLAPSGNTSGLALSTAVGNYRVDVLLSAAESRGLAKVLSRPRVVTQNNVTAVVRQGYRIPIVTQSQLGGPATTTYIDAFLRLTVTPQITVENTIFLAVDVENTTPDFGNSSTTVGGNPSLLTQQATTQVLVSDGGTVVIGGVIQTQSSINIQQVPWLGNIPILGNLFKSRSVSTSTQELIFILSPKIVQT